MIIEFEVTEEGVAQVADEESIQMIESLFDSAVVTIESVLPNVIPFLRH
jgi:hypothetical protein